MKKAISVKRLKFSYGNQVVLKNINFDVNEGQIVGLIGENGAGKTTLLNILLGLLPSNKTVEVMGNPAGTAQRIGLMRQENLNLTGVTVKDILQEAEIQTNSKVKWQDIVEKLDLKSITKHKLSRLSGGQLRQVNLGMAMIGNPRLLFLDEPTVGMDAKVRQNFWHIIQQLKKQGVTILITSHYLEEIQQVADQILILNEGKIEFDGTLAELQSEYLTSTIVFKTDVEFEQFKNLSTIIEAHYENNEIELITSNSDKTLYELQPYLMDLYDIQINKASLENIFITMMKGTKSHA